MRADNSQIVMFLLTTTFLLLMLMCVIAAILYLYQQKRILFNQHITTAKLEIQEETFQNISREIHDNIGLCLTVAKLNLNTLNYGKPKDLPSAIESSVELIGQAINDLSDISKSLNSEAIGNLGFLAVLQMKLDKIRRTGKYEVLIEVNGTPAFMDSQKELILFRITQEALNNIIKHANASIICMKLDYTESHLSVSIGDNGIGINWQELEKNRTTKIMAGLDNMQKRAKLINGTSRIDSDTSGTTIHVTIPIQ